jgi:hypothetical protein
MQYNQMISLCGSLFYLKLLLFYCVLYSQVELLICTLKGTTKWLVGCQVVPWGCRSVTGCQAAIEGARGPPKCNRVLLSH